MNRRAANTHRLILLALPLLMLAAGLHAAVPAWQEHSLRQILLLGADENSDPRLLSYRPLVVVRSGEKYQYRRVRQSIENLYRSGVFSAIEVKVLPRDKMQLDLLFILRSKPVIRSLEFSGTPAFGLRELRTAVYSMRKNELFEESRLPKAQEELQVLFKAKGYFNAQSSPRVSLDRDGSGCHVHFVIAAGRPARISQLKVSCDDGALAGAVLACFPSSGPYLPSDFARGSDKVRKLLKQRLYYFPEIKVQEEFSNSERTAAQLAVSVACGFKYHFFFKGMAPRMALIADVWERRVFEKWAEEESRARLLNSLKNEGYLDARVDSAITTRGVDKTIVYTAVKNRRYRLGKITIHGNHALATAKIREIMHADDVPFHKLAWLRLNSLVADMEVLKLYYYYLGISPIDIRLQPSFRGRHADIDFFISEGRHFRMGSIEFSGNRAFSPADLYRQMKSRIGSPYVPRQLSEDIGRLQSFYRDNGYDEAAVSYELSPGEDKTLLVVIREGQRQRMGALILIGASAAQRQLLRKLFPLAPGAPFSRSQVEAFRTEAENSALFSEIRLLPIARDAGTIDVLVKVTPDRSRLYGFGVGWEERRGPRGTLEYQEKNIFNSIYSVAATLQAGIDERGGKLIVNERRGILSFDAPYLFHHQVNSSFKVWEEDEKFPSYRFIRWGLGTTFVKKFSENLYLLGSAKWYRTSLKELSIPVFGIDQLDQPFDTTALQLSFVNEGRNDPFNPQRGHFLTADLKLGLPVFEKDYTFLKFYWNYQKHYPLFRDGTFSFSVKNGIGFGDMSITERFFAGGYHSFRGARNDRLGPIHLETNEPEGGNVLLLINLEATLPSLLPIKDLYYTVFADVGNVFAKSSDLNLKKMERAVGFGLKYRSPLGPIRIEFAFNLRKAAEKSFHFIFTIGNVY